MRERERPNPANGSNPSDSDSDQSLEQLRRQGEDFLAAGDAAIRRGLSTNSEAFLRASRQRGGQ